MAISSPGIGSGLDINSIVTKLVALERQPVVQLQAKGATLQTKLSAYSQIKSALATLDDAAGALTNADTWKGRTFTSNSTAVTGSATSAAIASSFSVQVNNLAQVQSAKSAQFTRVDPTKTNEIGSAGSLVIQLGQWSTTPNPNSPPVNATSFLGGTNSSPITVSVAATDTLQMVADNITNSGAGVSAIVVTSGGKDQLLIRGNTTGETSGFEIKAYDAANAEIVDGVTGVGAFAYTSDGVSTYGGMTQTLAAQDANITIDGITVTSATNSVTDAVPGVTLDLTATTTSAAQVTVAVDKDLVKTKIEAFRTAYNSARTLLTSLTKYDAATKTGGPLLGDSTAVGLESMLRNLAGASGPAATSSTIGRLSDMGLEMQRNGTLSANSTKLEAALGTFESLKSFLTNSDTVTASENGIARRIRDFVRGANGIEGNVTGRNAALQDAIARNSTAIDTFNARIALTETRLYAQFSRLDANMGTLNSLGTFVTQQIAQWNKTG